MPLLIVPKLARVADGSTVPIALVDLSNTGAGPFAIAHLLLDSAGNAIGPGNPLPSSDTNSVSFINATVLTSGASAIAAGRSVGVYCTAAGDITLTLSGGSAIAVPCFPGWQTFPFAATRFTFGSGTAGVVTNLY